MKEPLTWAKLLHREFREPYYQKLNEFVRAERSFGDVYPPEHQVFRALSLTPLDQVRVVILGQDPYCGPRQAHGLAFSVPDYTTPPPSLCNILQELRTDVGVRPPTWRWNTTTGQRYIDPNWINNIPFFPGFTNCQNGNLEAWAKRGVLLLNTCLTVRHATPGSHADRLGWETFTGRLLEAVVEYNKDRRIVFIAWGAKLACAFAPWHKIVQSPHPSVNDWFFGSRPFSRCNVLLEEAGQPSIDWSLQ